MDEQQHADGQGPGLRDNTIYIGKKPTMNYVLAVVTQFNNGAPEIKIKARGASISKAVDVAEIVRKRFIPGIKDPSGENIVINTEELTNEDGTLSKVSAIQIVASAPPGEGQAAAVPTDDNIIYIGKKPTMNYVLAVVTQFNGGIRGVKIKARGASISKAVDVAEIARSRYIHDLKDPSSEKILINSEELVNEDGTKSKVSAIHIVLSK